MGEEICVWIKLSEPEALDGHDIFDYCKGQIAHYKVPRYVRFIEEFPLTVTGKVKKNEMRHISNELLKMKEHDIHEIKKPRAKL